MERHWKDNWACNSRVLMFLILIYNGVAACDATDNYDDNSCRLFQLRMMWLILFCCVVVLMLYLNAYSFLFPKALGLYCNQ